MVSFVVSKIFWINFKDDSMENIHAGIRVLRVNK